MKITDEKIIQALKNGKSIALPDFTSMDEFYLSKNKISITTKGKFFRTGLDCYPIPLQINFLESEDWYIV